jgi:hypothetical protein
MRFRTTPAILVIAAAVFLTWGCDRDDSISFYQAPKEAPATQAAAPPVGAPETSTAPLTWKLPQGWKESNSSQQMRFATILVNETPPVELTVVPLGQEAGALLPNLNRWEGQLGLAASTEADLSKVVKHTDINGLHVDLVDLMSPAEKTPRQRMLAAITPHAGRIWFFKLSGPEPIVTSQKANFDAFLNSITPSTGAVASTQAAPPAPAGAPAFTAGPVSIKTFTTPPGWQQLPDQKPPRVLAFTVGQAPSSAELAVTSFPPTGAGSFLDNINRWRGQLSLEPIADIQSLKLDETPVGKDNKGVLFEIENPKLDPPKRMLVCIVSQSNQLWFFKLTGASDLVAAQREAFAAFLKSLEFSS